VDKRKLNFLFATRTLDVSFTFSLHATSAKPNRCTVANDSVVHAQQQWHLLESASCNQSTAAAATTRAPELLHNHNLFEF
jgi:hypothetical protein